MRASPVTDLVSDIIHTHVVTVHEAILASVDAKALACRLLELRSSRAAHLLCNSSMPDAAAGLNTAGRLQVQ